MQTPLEGVLVKDKQVVIYLNREGAVWLANELPPRDGFTSDLFAAIEQLEEEEVVMAREVHVREPIQTPPPERRP